MDQPESVKSFEVSEQDLRTITLTVREARWVFAALFRYRELFNELVAPEPEAGFLEDLAACRA